MMQKDKVMLEIDGEYRYQTQTDDDTGIMHFYLVLDRVKKTIRGSGQDSPGPFIVFGLYDGESISFLKQYVDCNFNMTWSYVGTCIEANKFSGLYGDGEREYGSFQFHVREKPDIPVDV